MLSHTCISCRVTFADGDTQRAHYKSDWHRYNLKRKVAEMPPVTAETFREKVLAQKAEMKASAAQKPSQHCGVCNKDFSSENAFANHLHSKKHKEQLAKKSIHAPIKSVEHVENERNVKKSVCSVSSDEDCDDESLETTQCLFCPHFSKTFEDNMRHMTKSHSFFIPDVEYVTDMEALIGYLGEKVGLGKLCLYCNGKGKTFYSIAAVQTHMRDKRHCKLHYEGDDVLEFSDFYDFTSSYPDGNILLDGESSEFFAEESALFISEKTGELCLSSGAKIGHRSLKNYYKQNLKPEQVKQNQIVVRGLMSDYDRLGWQGNISKANRLKIQNLKMKSSYQKKQTLKLNVKANKMQTRFREQVRY